MPSVPVWILIGVLLRALLLFLAMPVELQSDEAHYAWLGLGWERFGFLTDSQRFLWPPAYPFLHRVSFGLFQENGVLAVKILQIACSAATGWGVAALTRRLVNDRAAPIAVGLWAVHLPLAGYCALGWPEPLFLSLFIPSLVLLHDATRDDDTLRLIAAGVLLGLAALFKEIGLAIGLLMAAWLLLRSRPGLRLDAARVALTFLFSMLLPLAPWAARNMQHHAAPILSGSTLGENAYQGWNGHDINFDVLPAVRAEGLEPRPDTGSLRALRADPSTAWPRPGGATLPLRQSAKLRQGLEWVTSHPAEFLGTRVAKFAHMLAPLSFPVRHLTLGHYGGPLGRGLPAKTFLALSTLQSLLMLLAAAFALARFAPSSGLFWIPSAVLLAQPLIVGMSRLRVPLIPFLFIAIAALIIRHEPSRARIAGVVALSALVLLMLSDYRPIAWLLQRAWEVA